MYKQILILPKWRYEALKCHGEERVGMSGRVYLLVCFPGAEFKVYQDSCLVMSSPTKTTGYFYDLIKDSEA